MKILFFAVLLRGAISDSLPPKSELFASLKAFHTETEAVNLEPFKVKQKKAWLHWMPSFGVTLGKPTIGFSFAQVAANIENKALREAEKNKILRGTNLAFQTDSFTLVSQLEKWEMLKRSLIYLESIERVDGEAFEIQKAKYEKGEVLPLDWINIKSAHLRGGEPYRAKLEEIELLEIEIRKTAKY